MDSRNYKDLQEAYYEVYGDLNELKIHKPNRVDKVVGAITDIPLYAVKRARRDALLGKVVRQRAGQRLGAAVERHRTATSELGGKIRGAVERVRTGGAKGSMVPEEYEEILSYLLDEGYADSLESAEGIFEVMSDEWINEILDEGVLSGIKRRVKKH